MIFLLLILIIPFYIASVIVRKRQLYSKRVSTLMRGEKFTTWHSTETCFYTGRLVEKCPYLNHTIANYSWEDYKKYCNCDRQDKHEWKDARRWPYMVVKSMVHSYVTPEIKGIPEQSKIEQIEKELSKIDFTSKDA